MKLTFNLLAYPDPPITDVYPSGEHDDLDQARELAMREAVRDYPNASTLEILSDDGSVRELWERTAAGWEQKPR